MRDFAILMANGLGTSFGACDVRSCVQLFPGTES